MSKNTDRHRTADEAPSAADVRADEPAKSMDRLKTLTRKVLSVSRDEIVEREKHTNDPG